MPGGGIETIRVPLFRLEFHTGRALNTFALTRYNLWFPNRERGNGTFQEEKSCTRDFYASLLLAVSLISGCFVPQKQFTDKHRDFSLGKGELARHGLAFITPSTVTGQEEEKQGVALIPTEVLKEKRPDIRCVCP